MLSRVAANIHWMARYVERADNLARFLQVNLNLQFEYPDARAAQWEPLIQTTGDQDWFFETYGKATRENVMRALAFDTNYPNSIISVLAKGRENARTVREVISREMWQQLNELWLMVKAAAANPPTGSAVNDWLDDVRHMTVQYLGLLWTTMARGEAWHFYRLGELLERSDKTSRILDVKYFMLSPRLQGDSTIDHLQWTSLLRSADALNAYRQRHHAISPRNVADFLILEPSLPRSLSYCAFQAQKSLVQLSGRGPAERPSKAERLLGNHVARLTYRDIDDIITLGLHEFVDHHQKELNEVSDLVNKTFFL